MIEELRKLYGKRVKIITNKGKIIKGKFVIYERKDDNESEFDIICLDTGEINSFEEISINEIKLIEEDTK